MISPCFPNSSYQPGVSIWQVGNEPQQSAFFNSIFQSKNYLFPSVSCYSCCPVISFSLPETCSECLQLILHCMFDYLIQTCLPIDQPACQINQWSIFWTSITSVSTSFCWCPPHLLHWSVHNAYYGFSTVNVAELCCTMLLYTYCQNAYSVLCVVSSKRWLVMLLPGLAEILAAYQLYSVATQSLLQVLCLSQLPWCLQIPDKYFSVLLQCLPIPACCLAAFPCQTECAALLPVMCWLNACL